MGDGIFAWIWNGYWLDYNNSSSMLRGDGYTYYKGASNCSGYNTRYFIKRTQPRINYKAFSSF